MNENPWKRLYFVSQPDLKGSQVTHDTFLTNQVWLELKKDYSNQQKVASEITIPQLKLLSFLCRIGWSTTNLDYGHTTREFSNSFRELPFKIWAISFSKIFLHLQNSCLDFRFSRRISNKGCRIACYGYFPCNTKLIWRCTVKSQSQISREIVST